MSLGVELQADAAGTTTVPHDTITDFEQRELFEQTEQSDNVDRLAARYSAMYDQDSSAESGARPKVLSDIRSPSRATTAVCRGRRLTFDAAARSPTGVAGASMESVELQLQMRRLEMEKRAEIRLMEAEERERAHQHELELRRLEIQAGRTSTVPIPTQSLPFRVDAAIKLIPKFNEHDIESFLISFEKECFSAG